MSTYETPKARRRRTASQGRLLTVDDLGRGMRTWERQAALYTRRKNPDGGWKLKPTVKAYLAVVNGSHRLRGVTR